MARRHLLWTFAEDVLGISAIRGRGGQERVELIVSNPVNFDLDWESSHGRKAGGIFFHPKYPISTNIQSLLVNGSVYSRYQCYNTHPSTKTVIVTHYADYTLEVWKSVDLLSFSTGR
jgi:hypothetical protein